MKKTMKKILCSLLIVVMCLTIAPLQGFIDFDWCGLDFSISASALAETGKCGDNAYWNFNKKTGELTISGSGTMYASVFANQQDIKTVVIEEGITSVSYDAFWQCFNLSEVQLPNSLTSIYGYAFARTGLRLLTIPKNVSYIAPGFVMHSIKFKAMKVETGNKHYAMDGFLLCNKEKTEIIQFPMGAEIDSISLPDNIKKINRLAFNCAFYLKNIDLPSNLEYIGSDAFSLCIGLKNIVIPQTVKTIERDAFNACYQLADAYVLSKDATFGYESLCTQFKKVVGIELDKCYNLAVDLFRKGTLSEMLAFQEKYLVDVNPIQPYGTIHCLKGSSAETYAKQYGINYDNGLSVVSGYNYSKDSYSFLNINETIDYSYYSGMYGLAYGYALYKAQEKGTPHGHCFGMAYSTGTVINKEPSITTFNNKSSISDLDKSTYNSQLGFSVKDFIKYSHIYQFSWGFNIGETYSNVVSDLYDSVVQSIKNGKPVLINIYSDFGNHSVLAVGYTKSSILVDDSNHTYMRAIKFNGNSWEYITYDYTYSNKNGDKLKFANIDTEVTDFLTTSNNIYDTLVVAGKGVALSSKSELYEIPNINANDEAEVSKRCFWTSEKEKITSTNNTTESLIFETVNDDTIIETVLPKDSKATIDLLNKELKIETEPNTDVLINFISEDDQKLKGVSIVGVSNSSEVSVKKNNTSFDVSGISDGEISLIEDEKIIVIEEIICSDGNSKIKIEENEIIVDYIEKHSYSSTITTPATHLTEGVKTFICDCGDSYIEAIEKLEPHTYNSVVTEATCEKDGYTTFTCVCGDTYTGDKTHAKGHSYAEGVCTTCGNSKIDDCSCNCHKGGISGLIWKILRFFYKLFKINSVCGCGVKHY